EVALALDVDARGVQGLVQLEALRWNLGDLYDQHAHVDQTPNFRGLCPFRQALGVWPSSHSPTSRRAPSTSVRHCTSCVWCRNQVLWRLAKRSVDWTISRARFSDICMSSDIRPPSSDIRPRSADTACL